MTLIDSFAHPIHDRATLRFLFHLENEPERVQRAIFARTAQSFDPALIELLRSQVAKACAGTEISSRTVRALSLVSDRWDRRTVRNADFPGFAAHVLVAVASLAIADRIPPDAVEQALAPFDTTFEKLSQPTVTPAPLPSECPANREARVLIPTEPEYSAMAVADHVSGVFTTKMTLDDEGLVESVELLSDDEGKGAEVNSLRASTVVAAGSSSFAPGIADCRAVGGTYVFKATFRS